MLFLVATHRGRLAEVALGVEQVPDTLQCLDDRRVRRVGLELATQARAPDVRGQVLQKHPLRPGEGDDLAVLLHEAAAEFAAEKTGSAVAFLIAAVVVITWAISGPLFSFSDTWQLVINTGTTIVTFLMVFLIQNTQNRDSRALHAKLDSLIINIRGADNHLVEAEDLSEEELRRIKSQIEAMAEQIESRVAGRRQGYGAAGSGDTKES